MQISDLISIIGILLAIIAFINENERLFIWNKFSKTDKIFTIFSFAFIHYLLFFNWFLKNLRFLKTFTFSHFPSANTWAYLVSLGILLWILYKIFLASFPKENNRKVLEYYEFLLNKKEYSFFFNLAKKYNSKLLLNDSKKLEEEKLKLINLIFRNKQFLESTAEYNFDFFNSILDNPVYQKELIKNHIETQLFNEHSFFNSHNISDNKIKQFTTIFNKVDNRDKLINKCLKNSKINYKSILKLIFEYYKIDNRKSDNQIIESWLSIVKSNNSDALVLFTNMLKTEKITLENFKEITSKITTELSQIELPNDSVFLNEVLSSFLNILNRYYELDKNFSKKTITKIIGNSNNQLPEKIYGFYFDANNQGFENLKELINSIADE